MIQKVLGDKRTSRDAGQGSTKGAHHQQGSPQGSSGKAIDLAEQEHVLQDEHHCLPICAERQTQDEPICGVHREG